MATSNATPEATPTGATDDEFVDPVAEAIRAVIDPLVQNEKAIAVGFAERTRLLAELDRLGHDRRIIAGLCGDPIESGRDDPDTHAHGPAWDDEELARRTMAAEAGCALRLNFQTAGIMIFNAARLVEQLPRFHRALFEGRIGWGHVLKMLDVTAALPVDLPDHVLPQLEEMTLTAAEKLTPGKFVKVAREIMESLHPVPLQDRVDAGLRERRVVLRPDANGMSWLNAYLKADEAQAIYERLTQIAKALDDHDTAPADAPDALAPDALAPTPGSEPPARTRDQRRADCYRDLLLDGIGPGGLGRGIRGTVHITVPVLTLLGHSDQPAILDGYGPIDLETAKRLVGTATSFIRILTHPETGCTLSVGRTAHNPPADLRRYVQILDNPCQAPGCNRQAVLSETDHTHAWNTGGPTNADNLVSLCRPDHRLKHQSSFTTRQAPDGTLTWTSPGGKTYTNPRAHDLTRTALTASTTPPPIGSSPPLEPPAPEHQTPEPPPPAPAPAPASDEQPPF